MKWIFFILSISILCNSIIINAEEDTVITWPLIKKLGLQSNRQLLESAYTLDATRKALGSTKSKEKFQVAVKSSISVSKEGTETNNSHLLNFDTPTDSSSGDLAIQLSQVIWDGGKLRTQTQIQKQIVSAQETRHKLNSMDIRQNLSTQFFTLWYYQSLLKLNQDILKRRELQLKLIENRYKIGFENLGALLTTQANVEDAKFQILETEQSFLTAKLKLSQLVATDLSAFTEIMLESEQAVTPSIDQAKIIIDRHPAVLEASFNVNVAEAKVRATKALYDPDLVFTATAGKTISNPFQSVTVQEDLWNIKLVGSQILWDSGNRNNQVKQSESTLDAIRMSKEQITSTIQTNLNISYMEWLTKNKGLTNRRFTFSAIQERANIMQVQFEAGLISFNDWSLIEDKLIDSQKAVLSAQLEVYLAKSLWQFSKGETLDD